MHPIRRTAPFLPLLLSTALAAAVCAQGEPTTTRSVPLDDATAEKIRAEGIDHSHVHAILRDLTSMGHRMTGSDNFTRACEWARRRFREMGLEVEVQKWDEWKLVWNRGEWIGRIEQPIQLDMYVATDAWTAGTDGPTTGGFAIAPRNAEDLDAAACRGKWLIANRKPSTAVRDAAEQAGVLGVVYRAGDPNEKYPTRVRVFGNSRVARMDYADRPTLPEIAVRADDFDKLFELVESDQQPVATFDIQNFFREGPIALHNVIATLRGSEKPDEWVVVSSHLDSWHQAQGCTDNGTGSATTMEAARILTTIGARPKRSIKFCLWGGEEQGLLGSRGFVQRYRGEMDKVAAAFNHDTGTNWAQSLAVTEAMHEQLEPIFAQVNRLLTPPDADFDGPVFDLRIVERVSGGGGSDHASFIAARVPGLSWGLKGRSDYFQHTWHTQWDTFDVAIEEYQRHTATVIAMAALGTANLDELLDREGVEPGGGRRRQSSTIAAAIFQAELDGLTFQAVEKDGRADKLGIKPGDVLKKVDGNDVERVFEIFTYARSSEGDSIQLTFQRGETTFEATMKKSDLPTRGRGRDR